MGRSHRLNRRAAALAFLAAAHLASATPSDAKVLLSQDEALKLAFPEARVERRTAFLDESELEEVHRLAGAGVSASRAMVPYYLASAEGRPVGAAYFDTHTVRTEAETIMVVVLPGDRIGRIEVIAFEEPQDYLPTPAWIDQFRGRPLDDELAMKRGIRPMTGGTLTARAITAAARRVLALHKVIMPFGEPEP
ncbi:MAG: hypothetical protein ACE5HD_07715 [Acidobacteriota bacterium]